MSSDSLGFITNLASIPVWSKLADFHGFLAMLSLILFGASIILFLLTAKIKLAISWLKRTLLILFIDLVLLDIAGLTVYIPYRAPGGPRSILKASETSAWLHSVVFEHKEFLAFAPPILILVALYVVNQVADVFDQGEKVGWLRKSVLLSLILSLIFVLVVAAEAVLVTKAAPI